MPQRKCQKSLKSSRSLNNNKAYGVLQVQLRQISRHFNYYFIAVGCATHPTCTAIAAPSVRVLPNCSSMPISQKSPLCRRRTAVTSRRVHALPPAMEARNSRRRRRRRTALMIRASEPSSVSSLQRLYCPCQQHVLHLAVHLPDIMSKFSDKLYSPVAWQQEDKKEKIISMTRRPMQPVN